MKSVKGLLTGQVAPTGSFLKDGGLQQSGTRRLRALESTYPYHLSQTFTPTWLGAVQTLVSDCRSSAPLLPFPPALSARQQVHLLLSDDGTVLPAGHTATGDTGGQATSPLAYVERGERERERERARERERERERERSTKWQ